CIAASSAFAAAIAGGIAGADRLTMWSLAHAHAGQGDGAAAVRKCLETALETGPAEFHTQMGWVMIALSNAFHRLVTAESFEEALVATVGCGGDTDTNAAICGALLGAAYGRDAIPLRWRRQVLACRAVKGDGVVHLRTVEYWGDDAMDLAEGVLIASVIKEETRFEL
ncbi:MAG: ADP-ribosylglycohydrolase family protein, partial [Nitratireductor sp.]